MMMDAPNRPGCYLFKDDKGKIIYIGKAKNLKKRVGSYFSKKDHDKKTEQLVKNIDSADFMITDNEVEAFLLENTLIKKHKPKYNINLKDSKRYAYILVTDEEFPRIMTARDKRIKGKYFGPFVSGFDRQNILDTVRKTFRIRTCRKLPKRACLRYHINLCDAPCIGSISKVDYMKNVELAEQVLKGRTGKLVASMKEDMEVASKNKEFEKALILRDQIYALESLLDRQVVERNKEYDEDIINYIVKDGTVYMMLFKVYKGTLANKEEFIFDESPDFLDDFISQYYSDNSIPKELILPKSIDDETIELLSQKKGSKVIMSLPKIGEKSTLLKLVKKNIEIRFFGNIEKVESLKNELNLNFTPTVIECFDVSHISGTSTTASMVQFRNGIPDKSDYRRFKIISYEGNDDFSGISEAVYRRYRRLKEEKRNFPDLIIIDGGKGQLSAAIGSLKRLELRIPIFSVAKKEEELFVPGRQDPIQLSMKSKALLFIREIRDEAHRFAIKYNRLLRSKELTHEH